jgi:hypothetical protein
MEPTTVPILGGLRGDPHQVSIGLGQVGEFSFVLGSLAGPPIGTRRPLRHRRAEG